MKNIKSVKFVLENCEVLVIPFECFKKFNIVENNKNKNEIFIFECVIEDNNKSEYITTWSRNTTSPIQRLGQYNDICHIDIIYMDGASKEYHVPWYDSNPNSNKNQSSKMLDYKTVSIRIKPYIQKYSISEVLKFKNGTKFKDYNKNIYIVDVVNNIKKLFLIKENTRVELPLESTYINQKYIKIKDKN